MKKVGLVGGISWISTLDYYRFINEYVNKKLGGLDFANLVVYSVNYGDIQKVGWGNSYEILFDACMNLKRTDVEAIVLCANTAHMFADRLEEEVGLPMIHIVSATAEVIRQQGLKKVGLLGTKFTMEMDFYKEKLWQKGIEPIIPEKQLTRDFMQYIIKEELGKGIISKNTKEAYLQIIDELILLGAEGIVLGCTEIPIIISQKDVAVPVFDTTKIHSNAVVDFMLS